MSLFDYIINWFKIIIKKNIFIIFFDKIENIQAVEINNDQVIIIKTNKFIPDYKFSQIRKYNKDIVIMPDECELEQISDVKSLKLIQKDINRRINKLIIKKF